MTKEEFESRFPGTTIDCPEIEIGQHVSIAPGAQIRSKKLVIGDCTEIGPGFRVDCGEVTIGDYGVIYESCLLYGKAPLRIGHNFFLSGHSILNSYAPLTVGKGVGIGAFSQVWTHASWGEEIEGCLLNQTERTTIQDHAWLIGHVIVGAGVTIGERAVVLSGAMVARDALEGVFGGVPAKLINSGAYLTLGLDWKWEKLKGICVAFMSESGSAFGNIGKDWFSLYNKGLPLVFYKNKPIGMIPLDTQSDFYLDTKTYTKRLTPLEIEFMRFCRGGKVRFFPEDP